MERNSHLVESNSLDLVEYSGIGGAKCSLGGVFYELLEYSGIAVAKFSLGGDFYKLVEYSWTRTKIAIFIASQREGELEFLVLFM